MGVGLNGLLLLALAGLASISAPTLRVTRVNRYLYDANGNRFYIKGVAFQKPGKVNPNTDDHEKHGGFPEPADFIDPLADHATCVNAIKNFQSLNINTIRVYSFQATADHSACMNALEEAGIYVIADISLPINGSINRSAPSWDVSIMSQYIKQIESLYRFPNLLAFNIGNEVITNAANTGAAPFIKAAARDVKLYLKSINSHALVSYASTDGDKFPSELARYLSCDFKEHSIDMFGVNNYRWCGDSNFQDAYEAITAEFQGLPIVAFFSEFGCIGSPPRLWTEVEAIYSAQMSDSWSGGCAFSYYPTPQGYGLVNTAHGNRPQVNQDFTRLAAQYRKAKAPNAPKLTALSFSKQSCAATNVNSFVVANVLPPEPNALACSCADENAFSCFIRPDASSAVIGELLDSVCSAVSDPQKSTTAGGCNPIATIPSRGLYGLLSVCSPSTKLNYVMSQYFIRNGLNANACEFAGNATARLGGKPKTVSELDQEVKKCFEVHANQSMTKKLAESLTPKANSIILNQSQGPTRLNSTGFQKSISGTSKSKSKSAGAKTTVAWGLLSLNAGLIASLLTA